MLTELEVAVASLREKYEAAKQQAELYGLALKELEGLAREGGGVGRGAVEQAGPGPAKRERRTPVKAEVSASDAVLRLLAGCRMGLPAGEIVQHVATTYGYRPNSLRTTLYNLKRTGAIVRDEQRVYHHAENLA